MTIISCTVTFLLIIFSFILNCTTLCYAVPVKIPSRTREYNCTFIFKHSYIGIHKSNNGNGCTQRKRYIHWLPNASGELIQAVTICTSNQPAESSHSSQTTPCGNLMSDLPAISRTIRQRFFICLPLEACMVVLLREDCLVFAAMHLRV